MKNLSTKYLTLLLLMLFGLTACSDNNDPDQPEPPTPVSRTVLVYMVADNSLGNRGYDVDDLKEMIAAADADGFNGGRLLVYWNCIQTDASIPGSSVNNNIPPRLLEIKPEKAEVLKTYPDDTTIYSVDPERIAEVMTDVKTYAPADDYGLIMWSHANGWLGSEANGNTDRYRAFGDDRGYHISLPSLRKALEGNYFSFIYFDCCEMGNVESIYEFRQLTPVIAAAPTELPNPGMPYDLTIPYFFKTIPDVVGAAKATFGWYSTSSAWPWCQLAVYDTSALDRLAAESRSAQQLRTLNAADLAPLQRYTNWSKCYSYDMKSYYALLGAPASWHEALDDVVLWCASTPRSVNEIYIDTFCGLGSSAPLTDADKSYRGYNDLQWYKAIYE
ncbi:MAG: clostripain-related cysteine peptidase [Muribaculaceae bacterium]|nr:clostripain-related cysteine peptidase [Muribaculaceae bacterium]